MAISYNLLPIPKWYFADFSGKPLGGGFMQAWSSLDPNTPKVVFQDSGGQNAWPATTIIIRGIPYKNAILFDANGEQGPFFWQFNPDDPDDLYFLQIYDANGNIQFSIDDYGIPGGSGGGVITNITNLENYINNNVFWRNGGSFTFNSSTSSLGTVIAPSNHEGLVSGSTGFSTFPYAGSDILFVRNNNTATDILNFSTDDFARGSNPLNKDITPEFYINLQCTVKGTETLKAVQFPVDLHVKNFENQSMVFIIWAKNVSGNANLTASFIQYFGTNVVNSPVVTAIPINASPLSNSWQAYSATFTIPALGAVADAPGGDDATYLQVNFPAADFFQTYIAKPKLYIAPAVLTPELQTYDNVERIINSPRTGDIRTSINSFAPWGWVPANDGSIGSAASTATSRKNIDTWPLYALLYLNVLDHWAPVSGGRTGTTLTTAIADFSAGKNLTLSRALGRVLAGANPASVTSQNFTTNYAGSHFNLTVASSALYPTGTPIQLTNTGGALPVNLAANIVYYIININTTTVQLASTLELAYVGTPLDIGGDQTGTSTLQTALGAWIGLGATTLPAHTHTGTVALSVLAANAPAGATNVFIPGAGSPQNLTINSTGSTAVNTNMQPSTFMNVFIKL